MNNGIDYVKNIPWIEDDKMNNKIWDLDDYGYSFRHGRYGGQAGDKDGILIDGENWIVKYPKSTRNMTGIDLPSYTTSPLSEYIGSHIYSILGYDTHETILGMRNGQLVVACKDFQKNMGDLAEIRTIKNAANKQLSELSGEELPESATGDKVILEELLLHFKYNPLMNRDDLKERFWDCVVIDILIDNKDRNNGNWGLLWNEDIKGYSLAPIYDNGNSFETKASDMRLAEIMNDGMDERVTGGRTVYMYKDKQLSAKRMLELDIEGLKDALIRVVPKIRDNIDRIREFINNIPEPACSNIRKEYYSNSIQIRLDKLLQPVYEKHQQELDSSKEEEIDR